MKELQRRLFFFHLESFRATLFLFFSLFCWTKCREVLLNNTYFKGNKKDRTVENTYDSETDIKGSLTRDFRLQVFFMSHFSRGPWVSLWGHFEFLPKLAEIFATLCKDWINRLPVSEVIIFTTMLYPVALVFWDVSPHILQILTHTHIDLLGERWLWWFSYHTHLYTHIRGVFSASHTTHPPPLQGFTVQTWIP